VPAGAFYVWLTVPAGIDTSDLLAKAINHRVAYVPGRGFYADGSGGDQLRLCFSYPPARIREGVPGSASCSTTSSSWSAPSTATTPPPRPARRRAGDPGLGG
jgi:2-aminoadipate transaminase